jgi:hypothetical protein
VRALATFRAFAAVALVVFSAYLSAVLRAASGTESPVLAALAAIGGAVSAGFLLLDAILFWVLVLPSTTASPETLQAIHGLSYLAGGVALALPLGVLIGAATAGARGPRLLPRWVVALGVAATVTTLLCGTTLTGERGAWSPSGALVVFATLPLLWVATASSMLTLRRQNPTRQA